MLMSTQPEGHLPACAPEIQALGQMPSQAAMLGELLQIASRYGKVGEITPLDNPRQGPSAQCRFAWNLTFNTYAC